MKIEHKIDAMFRTMESKLIFILILHICVAQWNDCFHDKESHSKENIKRCFRQKSNLDPCTKYNCSENSACNSRNINDDVACLINSCQKKCKPKDKPCIIECLNLDSCDKNVTEEEYMDCIRKSTADSCNYNDVICKMRKCMARGKNYDDCREETSWFKMPSIKTPKYNPESNNPNRRWPNDPPRNSRTTANPYGKVTKKKDSDWWAISIVIVTFVVFLLLLAWPMFTAYRVSNRGNASSHTPVIDPQSIPKGAYPVQNIPTTVSAQRSQQSLGQGMTPYPVENQFELQSEATNRQKLPGLPEQMRTKSKQ